ncbi:MAG: hypothetical protein ACTSUG_17695 [Candidatus Helarchaeota archaeon]
MDSFLITEFSPNGIISFELAKELSNSNEIINAWGATAKSAAGLSLGFDFLFLLIYASFISWLVYLINDRLFIKSKNIFFKKVSILLPFIAAFFDVLENMALIKLLLGDLQQIWSSLAYYFAVIKFGLLIVVISYVLVGGLISIFKEKKRHNI